MTNKFIRSSALLLLALPLSHICMPGSSFISSADAEVVGKQVSYTDGETQMKGYLAVNSSIKGKRPGIVVVHEWWGHNSYARERADKLAELGYTAFALDMYGKGKKAEHPKKAMEFSKAVTSDLPKARKRFKAAVDYLKSQPSVDSAKIGAVGYCFGGGIVLNMALMGLDLDGVVSFHGSLPTELPEQIGPVVSQLLVCHGAKDTFVSDETISKFKQLIEKNDVQMKFESYPNAKHSFTSPAADEAGKKFDLPLEYNNKADKKSWEDMKEFFSKVFK